MAHALKFFDYVNTRNGRVILGGISNPTTDFESVGAALMQALENEQKVSAMINKLYEISSQEKDYASQVLLEWFITEQVEEEKSVTDVIDQLRISGGEGAGLLILDDKLAARVSEPEPPIQ